MPMTFDRATVDGTGAFLVHELERLDQTLNPPLVNFTGRAISSCVKTCLLLMRSARSLTPLCCRYAECQRQNWLKQSRDRDGWT